MPQSPATVLQERLVNIALESEWFMSALCATRELGLSSWCIGAGAVRNLVWDKLHGFHKPTPLSDIDVAYFDASVISAERDAELQDKLTAILPGFPWEVTNQAAVHLWFKNHFGYEVLPLQSLEEAIASWPEFATTVGVTLLADNSIQIISPHGLDDLFSLTVRRNPIRVSVNSYRQRVLQKRYTERWPKVKVIDC
jgi:hypothetical protein